MNELWPGPRAAHAQPRAPRRCCVAVLAALLLAGCASAPQRFAFEEPHMGTVFRIVLYDFDPEHAAAAAQAAFARVRELNGILSDYDGSSELNRLCRADSAVHPVLVSEDLWEVLALGQDVAERSGGAFDVTVGPLVRLWRRAARLGKLPAPSRLDKARKSIGHSKIRLWPARRFVSLFGTGMQLDLGGIAKGYAAAEALEVLRARGIASALVDAGGDLAVGAAPPDTPGWTIGLVPLAENGPPSCAAHIASCGVATSGDAFRFVEIEGRRFSHIVDPRSGMALTERSSVTVVAPDPTLADALASAISVLGPESGLALLAHYPGASALMHRIIDGEVEIFASPDFPRRFARDGAPADSVDP